MKLIRLVDQAHQMLELLGSLEDDKAYDLDQLAEHTGVTDRAEAEEVAQCLKSQGCVAILNREDGMFLALRSMEFDPGQVLSQGDKDEQKKLGSPFSDVKVDLIGNSPSKKKRVKKTLAGHAPPDKSNAKAKAKLKAEPKTKTKTKTKPIAKKEPAAETDPIVSSIGDLTISQILLSLTDAVEQSEEIDAPQKWPLVEKLRDVATHPAIQLWLQTPLKDMAIGS